MEQHNYSHGKFSPFDNLPYRLAPPQPLIAACVHTHKHKMFCHLYRENLYTTRQRKCWLMSQSKRKHLLSGEFISINNMRTPLLALFLHVYNMFTLLGSE